MTLALQICNALLRNVKAANVFLIVAHQGRNALELRRGNVSIVFLIRSASLATASTGNAFIRIILPIRSALMMTMMTTTAIATVTAAIATAAIVTAATVTVTATVEGIMAGTMAVTVIATNINGVPVFEANIRS